MPLDRESYKWAALDETEGGLPNKQNPAPEVKNSGLKSYQPEPRGWYNWQMNKLGEGLNLVEDEYTAAVNQEISDRENADTDLQNQIDALTQSILQVVYPVGKYYFSEDSTSPSVVLGFGTWVRVEGRFIVGLDEVDADFDLAGEQGGSKTHTHTASTTTNTTTSTTVNGHSLTIAEMPAHTHDILYRTSEADAGTVGTNLNSDAPTDTTMTTESTGGGDPHSHTASSTSSSTSNTTVDSSSNLPPYEVAYIWKRTA